ncbi:MAG: DUF167 domain-containing protein [Elusimicrobiota bacterium]
MFIKLKVHPDSKTEKIIRKSQDKYEIWVKSPAERGLANFSAMNMLAKELGIEVKRLAIIKGSHSPSKIVKIL